MFTQARKIGPFIAGIVLLSLIAMAAPARAELITGSEYVSGFRSTAAYDNSQWGPYYWDFGYTMGFDGTTVTADVPIALFFHRDVPADDQAKSDWKTAMENAIEAKWNNQHTFEYDGVTITSVVDVRYHSDSIQSVIVKPGSGATDLNTWYWAQTGMTSAHEFGHMIGLYDEYWGGALNPAHFVDTGSLMGTVSGDPAMPDRYYQPFVDFVVALQVPEPATTTMIISCVLAILTLLRPRRK